MAADVSEELTSGGPGGQATEPGSVAFRERLARIEDPLGLLEGMFAHSPVPYIVFTADGHPLVWNRAYTDMFGAVPPPEYNVLEDEVTRQLGLSDAVQRAFQGHTVHMPTFWYDPKQLRHIEVTDAKRVAISCTFFPLLGKGRALTHVAVAFRDVTAELDQKDRAEAERDHLKDVVEHKEHLARALRESEERLRDTLDAAEVGTWEWDIAADRVHWSSNIERIFGLEEGAFAGTYEAWIALVHPDDRDRIARKVSEALSSNCAYEAEFRFHRPDGSTGWQAARAQVVVDEAGRAKLLRGIVLDVTEQVNARAHADGLARALRASDERYRTFLSQSTEGIWRIELGSPIPIDTPVAEQIELFYRDAHLAESNDAMARMYGYETADELLGKRLGDLLVQGDPRNAEYLAAFVESNYRLENAESQERDRAGARRVFHNTLIGVVEQGQLVRAWGTQRNVTAQVEAREEAEAANQAKDEFLAMLGHELRNPLSPILTALELMTLRGDTAFQKERAIIARQVSHVVRLVDDLLDISRITRGRVPLELSAVDLADSVAAAVELTSPLLERRAHHLTVEVPRGLMVHGDPTRLSQVLTNLLTNASKFTPERGQIALVGGVQGALVQIRVRDTGIGIRSEILPKIFDRFVQERQALDRSEGGLGLGLAIVRSLVTLHGGTVEAQSEGAGKGSEFIVSLPQYFPPEQLTSALQDPRRAAGAEGRRILVVDDNEDLAELLSATLTEMGHVVRVAHDGPAALQLLEEFTPDVALLDIGLPVMDGYELARRIRAMPNLANIGLVAITGYGQAKDRAMAKAAGFDQHIVKPVDLAALEQALQTPPQVTARDHSVELSPG